MKVPLLLYLKRWLTFRICFIKDAASKSDRLEVTRRQARHRLVYFIFILKHRLKPKFDFKSQSALVSLKLFKKVKLLLQIAKQFLS